MTPKAKDGPLALSGLVVAHNEEAQLADCLACLAFCDEIVVVLDRCDDGSRAIAAGFTDRLVEGAWPIEGPRREAGIAACRGAWIFELDADERVSDELAQEIRRAVGESGFDYHRVPYDNYIGRRLVRYGWGAQFGVSSRASLFRKGIKTWGDQRVHPRLTWKPGARQGPRLENRLVHLVDRDIAATIARLNRYSSARALDLLETGDIGSAFHNYRRIVSRFWKCFVGRKGYREGGMGFLIALCAALYPILSYLKARHAAETAEVPERQGPDAP